MAKKNESWVVYEVFVRGKAVGMNAVCEQAEWEKMEIAQPGNHTLIQSGITNEGVAERLARSTGRPPVKLTGISAVVSETLPLLAPIK